MNKPALFRRGVTLVEMLIVVGILGIVLAAAAPSIADIMARRRVEMVAAELATNLAYARSEAGVRPLNVMVFFGGNSAGSCYSLVFWGGGGTCDCTLGAGNACSAPGATGTEFKTVQVPSSTGVSISPSVSKIKFVSPHMSVDPASPSVTVSSNRVGQLQLSMNVVGRLSSCSPDGSITGVARC